jgi:hypothetical protein
MTNSHPQHRLLCFSYDVHVSRRSRTD